MDFDVFRSRLLRLVTHAIPYAAANIRGVNLFATAVECRKTDSPDRTKARLAVRLQIVRLRAAA